MKHPRFFRMKMPLALAVAAAFALPAFGQQDSSSQPQTPPAASVSTTPATAQSSNSSSQPAGQASSQNSAQPAQASSLPQADETAQKADNLQPLAYQKHEGFWGHLNPFARKNYVKRQLKPTQDRLNELDELTASNANLLKDVDARATRGIQLATSRANDADQHALDAGNRAQLANQTATQANTRLSTVQHAVQNIDQYQASSQVELHFRPGQQVLSKRAKDALDQMATPLKDQKGYIVEVQGFSSGRGMSAIQNSDAMADSVVRYLVLQDAIPVYRIYKVGMGNAPITAEGKAKRIHGGVVEISLLKNSVGDLSMDTAQPFGSSANAASESTSGESTSGSSAASGSTSSPANGSAPNQSTAPNGESTSQPQAQQPQAQPQHVQPQQPSQQPQTPPQR